MRIIREDYHSSFRPPYIGLALRIYAGSEIRKPDLELLIRGSRCFPKVILEHPNKPKGPMMVRKSP